MSPRSNFVPVHQATQGVGGNNNLGVVVVRHRPSNKTYIEKRVRPSAIKSGDMHHEIRVMQQLRNHPNIVNIVNYDLNNRSLGYGSLYMQHAELGSLDALIQRFTQHRSWLADEGFAWKVLYDLSIGLAFLWTGQNARIVRQVAAAGRSLTAVRGWNPVMHRDIKPSNVFMTWHGHLRSVTCPYPTILLGDFGCAVTLEDCRAGRGRSNNLPGNDVAFAPPEYPSYSEQSDIFSIALVIICIAWRVQIPPRNDPRKNDWASEGMGMVLTQCMRGLKEERPTPFELPRLVWRGYQMWCAGRSNCGVPLPEWAFGI